MLEKKDFRTLFTSSIHVTTFLLPRGGKKPLFKDTLKEWLRSFNVNVDNWKTVAQERDIWRRVSLSMVLPLLSQKQSKTLKV